MLKEARIIQEKPIVRFGFKRQRVLVITVLVVIVGLLTGSYLFFHPKVRSFTLHTYQYATVSRRNIVDSLQVLGFFDLSYKEILEAPVSGKVVAINVREGDTVRKGQTLIILQSKEVEDSLEETEYKLAKLVRERQRLVFNQNNTQTINRQKIDWQQHQKEYVTQDLKTKEDLYRAGAISKEEYDAEQEKYLMAVNNLVDAQAELDSANKEVEFKLKDNEAEILFLKNKGILLRNQLKACNIFSPFDGKVIELKAEIGSNITIHSDLIKVADLKQPVVKVKISENKIERVQVGQHAVISIGDHKYHGKVHKIEGKAIEATESTDLAINTEVSFDKPPTSIIPGSTVLVDIELGLKKMALSLPRGQYLTTGNHIFVYKRIGQKAYKSEVNFGLINNSLVEIFNGLREGDSIIVSGYQDFIDLPEIILNPQGGTKVDKTN
jgi:HlyD family secretion protein